MTSFSRPAVKMKNVRDKYIAMFDKWSSLRGEQFVKELTWTNVSKNEIQAMETGKKPIHN